MRNLYGFRYLLRTQGPLLGLILLIFVIFFCQNQASSEWYASWMAVPSEIVESWHRLREGTAATADGKQFATMLSCAFLHGSFEHVLYNMLYLWIFAALTVELLGHRWMLFLFFFTAFTGSLLHVALNRDSPIPCLGASGAVMGFEGAYLGMATRWHLPDPHIWPMSRPIPPTRLALIGVIGLAFDYFSLTDGAMTGIAHGAHIGGFVGGLFLTALLAPKPANAWAR